MRAAGGRQALVSMGDAITAFRFGGELGLQALAGAGGVKLSPPFEALCNRCELGSSGLPWIPEGFTNFFTNTSLSHHIYI